MDIPVEIFEQLKLVVKEAFSDELITHISVEDVVVDAEAREIRITLRVDTTVDPKEFAQGYFGLTSRVRKSLAGTNSSWDKFFPVITPSVSNGAHA